MITPISTVTPISIPSIGSIAGTTSQPGAFQKVMEGAVNTIETAHTDATNSIQNFLTGGSEDLHTTALAVEKSEMAFDLGMQVRNKVVSAYQEVMRMPL